VAKTISITLEKGEKKPLKFTFYQKGTTTLFGDMTGATFSLVCKKRFSDATPIFTKDNSSFDGTSLASSVVRVTVDDTDIAEAGKYKLALKTTLPGGNIDKTEVIDLIVNDNPS
jgi:hypothetical protein